MKHQSKSGAPLDSELAAGAVSGPEQGTGCRLRLWRWWLWVECSCFVILTAATVWLRSSVSTDWPAFHDFQLSWWPEVGMVASLAICCVVVAAARKAVESECGIRIWLLVAVGLAFLAVAARSRQVVTLYSSGMLSGYAQEQIHEQADIYYVQAVSQRLRQHRDDLESQETLDGEEIVAVDPSVAEVVERLINQAAVWTEQEIGHWLTDPDQKRALMWLLAYQIYPHGEHQAAARQATDFETRQLPRRRKCFQAMEAFCARKVELFEQERALASAQDETAAATSPMAAEFRELESLLQEQLRETEVCEPELVKPIIALTRDSVTAAECEHGLDLHLQQIDARLEFVAEQVVPLLDQQQPVGLNQEFPWLRLPMVITHGNAWLGSYLFAAGLHLLHLLIGVGLLVFGIMTPGVASNRGWMDFMLGWWFVAVLIGLVLIPLFLSF